MSPFFCWYFIIPHWPTKTKVVTSQTAIRKEARCFGPSQRPGYKTPLVLLLKLPSRTKPFTFFYFFIRSTKVQNIIHPQVNEMLQRRDDGVRHRLVISQQYDDDDDDDRKKRRGFSIKSRLGKQLPGNLPRFTFRMGALCSIQHAGFPPCRQSCSSSLALEIFQGSRDPAVLGGEEQLAGFACLLPRFLIAGMTNRRSVHP